MSDDFAEGLKRKGVRLDPEKLKEMAAAAWENLPWEFPQKPFDLRPMSDTVNFANYEFSVERDWEEYDAGRRRYIIFRQIVERAYEESKDIARTEG